MNRFIKSVALFMAEMYVNHLAKEIELTRIPSEVITKAVILGESTSDIVVISIASVYDRYKDDLYTINSYEKIEI